MMRNSSTDLRCAVHAPAWLLAAVVCDMVLAVLQTAARAAGFLLLDNGSVLLDAVYN